MSSYIITGPTTIGTTGQLNTFRGNVTLTDIGTATGDIYYAAAGGNLTALAIGSTGNVLTVVGGLPAWTPSSGVLTGFSVAKTAGDTFNNTQSVIANWNTTQGSTSMTTNPYYLSSTSIFNTTTGVFTPPTTGEYQINANISYIGTSNANNMTLTFAEKQGTTPTFYAIATNGPVQGSGNPAMQQTLKITGTFQLSNTASYVITIQADATNGTNTISSGSLTTFSATLIA